MPYLIENIYHMGNIKEYIQEATEIMARASNDNLLSEQEYLIFLDTLIKEARLRYEATKEDIQLFNTCG